MCVIAVTPPGQMLTAEIIKDMWDDNDDGAGYMFSNGAELVIRKPFWKYEDLLASYEKDAEQFADYSSFVMHFRWATHGELSAVNCHPHRLCGGKVGMVHNGIFADTPPANSKISDTVYFCRTVLAKRQPSQLLGARFRAYLDDAVGVNRIVFMDWTGKISIVNEMLGDTVDGVWFSNLNFMYPSSRWAAASGATGIGAAPAGFQSCGPSNPHLPLLGEVEHDSHETYQGFKNAVANDPDEDFQGYMAQESQETTVEEWQEFVKAAAARQEQRESQEQREWAEYHARNGVTTKEYGIRQLPVGNHTPNQSEA